MKKFLFTLIGIVVCIGASANDKITIEIQDLVLANGEKESDVLDVVTGRLSIQPGNLAFVAKVGDNKAVKPLKTGGWIFGKSVNKTLKKSYPGGTDYFYDIFEIEYGCNTTRASKAPSLDFGDMVFCEYPQTNTCLNAGYGKNESGSGKTRLWNDFWEGCRDAYCSGYDGAVPENAVPVMDDSSIKNKCWWWSCINGFSKNNNKCICSGDNTYITTYKKNTKVCAKCTGKDMYIIDRNGKPVCAKCTGKNIYVDGVEGKRDCESCPNELKDGKCEKTTKPPRKGPDGPKIINPPKPPVSEKPGTIGEDNRTECEKGTKGYVDFEGECITEEEKGNILEEREKERIAKEKAQKILDLQSRIDKAANVSEKLVADYSSAKKSVWKDADGKFNKARLASDSIAGIVMGATGGLITHSVVKKSQIKKGLEDVACFVGDSEVANFGDEFTVGLK